MDVTGDGIADIISGDYVADKERQKGLAYQYVIAGKADGSYAKPVPIKASDGKALVLPGLNGKDRYDISSICTHPFACDWDGDGDLDLLVGNFQGTFYLAENTGNAGAPAWQAQGEWIQGGSDKLLGLGQKKIRHSAPFVIDWDDDGDLDILSGDSSGGVFWAKNSGTREAPVFDDFEELIAKPNNQDLSKRIHHEEQISPGTSTRLWVTDVNDDGIHDLLVGDLGTLNRKKDDLSEEEFTRLQTEYDAKMTTLNKERSEMGPDAPKEKMQKFYQRYHSLHNKYFLQITRKEFLASERTGFVWLYLGQ